MDPSCVTFIFTVVTGTIATSIVHDMALLYLSSATFIWDNGTEQLQQEDYDSSTLVLHVCSKISREQVACRIVSMEPTTVGNGK
jgi:hypothetical protein